MKKIPIIDVDEARKHLENYSLVARVIRWAKKPRAAHCPLGGSGIKVCERFCGKVFLNLTKPREYDGYNLADASSPPFVCPCGSYGMRRTAQALLQLVEDLL